MARQINPQFGPVDSVLFLTIRWGGGQANSLADIIFLYDWVNRDIPTAEDLDGGLNRLIAARLLHERRGRFRISANVMRKFDAFRQRRRRNRFEMAKEFVQAADPLKAAPRRVTIRREDQRRAYAEYHQQFETAWGSLHPGTKKKKTPCELRASFRSTPKGI
jgi:hypothetical protein